MATHPTYTNLTHHTGVWIDDERAGSSEFRAYLALAMNHITLLQVQEGEVLALGPVGTVLHGIRRDNHHKNPVKDGDLKVSAKTYNVSASQMKGLQYTPCYKIHVDDVTQVNGKDWSTQVTTSLVYMKKGLGDKVEAIVAEYSHCFPYHKKYTIETLEIKKLEEFLLKFNNASH